MRSDRLAEWCLALVAPRERATAICGDLAEESQARGMRWFWTCVARTWVALAARETTIEPGRLVLAALAGWVVYVGIVRVLFGIGLVAVNLVWTIGFMAINRIAGDVWTELLHFDFIVPPPQWLLSLAHALVVAVGAPFAIGYLAAERQGERAVAFAAIATVTWAVLMLATPAVYLVGDRIAPTLMVVVSGSLFVGVCVRRGTSSLNVHA